MHTDSPEAASLEILQQLTDGVILTDSEGRIRFVNDAARRIHGVAKLDVPVSGYTDGYHLMTMAGEPYPPHELPLARAVLRGETVVDALWKIGRPDGTLVIARGNAMPLVGPDRALRGAILTVRDVTAQHLLEQALERSEARYRLLTDSLPHIVWTCRPDGSCDFFNEYTAHYTGIPVSQCLDWGWRTIIHPDDFERTNALWLHSVRTGEPYETELRLRTADGSWRWNLDRGGAVRDERGHIVAWLGTSTDIEDRRRIEAEMAANHEQYRTLAEAIPHIVFSARPDGTSDYLNRQWFEYTGSQPGDGIYSTWHSALHPDDLAHATGAWARSLLTGVPFEAEYRLRGADQRYRWFLALGVPQRDARGQITRWFGTATNIDRQKREEAKQRFLVRLTEETRSLYTVDSVLQTTLSLLCDLLQVTRATYAEVDEADRIVVRCDSRSGPAARSDSFPLSDLTEALHDSLRAGRTVLLQNSADTSPLPPPFDRAEVRSLMVIPLVRDERLASLLWVDTDELRYWTAEEAELLGDVMARTWLALENARLHEIAQREAEERRRIEEHRYRLAAIVESSQDAIISKDLDGIVTSWNAAAERVYGYSALEMIGRHQSVVLPPDRADELSMILTRIRRGERIDDYDTMRLRKDGTLVPVSLSVSPVFDATGQVIGAAAIARDITERVRAETERREMTAQIAGQRQRLDDLISSVPGVVWEAWGHPDTQAQRINFVSHHVQTLLGYTVEEWLATPNFWLTIVHPDDRERAAQVASEKWRTGEEHTNEFRWIRKDGTAIWCEAHSVVIKDQDGNAVGMRGVTLDVSARKQAEAERARHLSQIETLNEQLRRAMTETHHRVRNSLQIIAALVDMEAPDDDAAIPGDALQRIGGHVRALATVHDLLTEQAKHDSAASSVSARAVLQKLVELVRRTAGGVRIDAQADDTRLSTRQGTSLAVITNELMTNAIKYGRSAIVVRFTVQDRSATLEILDDGPGFPPNFDPEQGSSTGLELVSHVARWDLSAEELRFETRPEGGGRVLIRMPLGIDPVNEARR